MLELDSIPFPLADGPSPRPISTPPKANSMSLTFFEESRQIGDRTPIAYREKRFAEIEEALLKLVDRAEDTEQKVHALLSLGTHYHFVENLPAAEKAIEALIQADPQEVLGWLGLAEHFHYYDEDFERAASNIEIALAKALAKKELVRQVLGARIRIALLNSDYALVHASLAALIEYQKLAGAIDVAFEKDFISQIPPHTVDMELLDRYVALAGK